MRRFSCLTLSAFAASFLLIAVAGADDAAPLQALAQMPVKEITVFKDGHALLLHRGVMPTDGAGNVVLDHLPAPVLGTFWPFADQEGATLSAVIAGQRKVSVERTALSIRELLEANVGREAFIREQSGETYFATILAVPERTGGEMEATSPPGSGEMLPQQGSLIVLATPQGTRAVPIDTIRDLTFPGDHDGSITREEFRNLLTLKLDWAGGRPQPRADVGMLYLQRGVRWIPNYKIEIDGQGSAQVTLQATLINEMIDLENVTAHLVIGVPTFAFAHTIDPMALQASLAPLSSYFQQGQTGASFSNAIMAQSARMGEYRDQAEMQGPAAIDLGPEVAGSDRAEDLFVFSVERLSLKKGQRLVLTIAEFALKYRDVYTLDLPFGPPPEVQHQFNFDQQEEIARLLRAPKAMHTLRFVNESPNPLTTAPALILRDGRALAQGMMTYASIGAESDLKVTAAVDIRVKKSGREVERFPDSVTWRGSTFGRINMAGSVALTNFKNAPVTIEVTRHVLGNLDSASHDGALVMVNMFEDEDAWAASGWPTWWRWYSWPYWWVHFNGLGRVKWTVNLDPGESIDLDYYWHYFWD